MVRLEPLTIEKAKRAFVAVAGSSTASDPLLDSIVTASACVPVALELLALDVRNSGGVASVWERLQRVVVGSPRESGDETDVAVDRALAAVVEHLAIEARRLLAVAAMFRDGIAVSDVGMLEGIDESTVSQLATAGVTSPPVQRCAVVAALIEPVKRIVPAATADVARLYAFYLRQVDELSPLAGQPFGDQAVEKLTRELRNIEASLSTCLRQGSIAAARAALKYGNYVRHSGLGDPTILDRARDVADAHGDTQLKAQSASCRADIALSAFDHRLARTRYEEARQDYHTIKEAAGESHCLRNIGVIALRTQHWSAARACFEQSLALSRTAGDRVGEASAIERLGDLALAQDQFEAAREHFQEALVRYHELGDASEADCWLSLGQIAAHAHDIDHAREFFEKALALHRSAGHQLGVANSLLLRAELDVKQAPVQAERDLREALGGYRRVGNVRGEANARLLLAEIAAAQNARDKASALFRAALLLFQSADDPAGEATVFGRLADVAAEEGRSEDARAYREEADALIARLRS
jgi:tetratricopeptide (TPR) repeat protein